MEALTAATPRPPVAASTAGAPAWVYVGLGVLLGLPISYPGVPYYWAAFAVFGIALLLVPFDRFNRNPQMVFAVLALCVAATISNLLSPYPYVRDPGRFVTSVVFYLFFLFGLIARDHRREIVAGLAAVILLQAAAVLAASLVGFRWDLGLLAWSLPAARLWGQGWFPDWPNFYAILLSVGFLLFLLQYRRLLPAAVCLLAAVLTTSRVPALALLIGVGWMVLFGRAGRILVRVLAVGAVLTVVALVLAMAVAGSDQLGDFMRRMGLLSDREEIWRSSLALFLENPWFGLGGVMLDFSVGHAGYASFHNSYAEVLVRHGLVGFALYLFLLLGTAGQGRLRHPATAIVAFLLLSAVVQNTLRQPHFFMMYSFFALAAIAADDER